MAIDWWVAKAKDKWKKLRVATLTERARSNGGLVADFLCFAF